MKNERQHITKKDDDEEYDDVGIWIPNSKFYVDTFLLLDFSFEGVHNNDVKRIGWREERKRKRKREYVNGR